MTGTVPRARRRATPPAPPTAAAPPAGTVRPSGSSAPAERLAALLADAGGADPAAPGAAPEDAVPPASGPAHRWAVAPRTRVPASLLLLALAALAGLAWAVLGPPGGAAPGGAEEPALAEVELTPAPDATASGAPTGAGEGPGPSPGQRLYVHVTGAVARPGVVALEPGARVVDAVEAAGGLTDAAVAGTVNLAAPVTDGQQVLVPDEAAAGAPAAPAAPGVPPAAGEAGAAPGGTLDLNTATAADLEALPRVGPVLAERIVAFRDEHGGFAAVGDLDAVPGIGPALMEALAPLVTV